MNHRFRAWVVLSFVLLASWTASPAQSLQDQIAEIFNRPQLSGNVWTGMAVNESGTLVHYSHQPDTPRIPASNAKITVTAAAFDLLGPDHTFESRVYANGPITNGVLNGDLNLVVEHDITWSTRYFGNARTPLNHIATRVRIDAGITTVNGTIRVYGASVYNHGQFDNLNSTSQQARNSSSAAAFRDALIANNVTVSGGSAGHTGFSPPGTLVHTHQSSDAGNYTLNMAIRPLNKISINPAADMLQRHIGYKLDGDNPASDNYAAGRVHVEAWLASPEVPVDATGFVQFDGSGLSRNNRISARQMIDLMKYMHEKWPSFEPSYTIACTDGTLGGRLCGADTTGRVHGKTGSLSVTISLSGYVRNRHINERVYFSFIHYNAGGINQSATRVAMDDAVRLLAAADVPTHNPPERPDFFNLRTAGAQSSFVMQWNTIPDADQYVIYQSVEGGPFELRRQVNAPTTTIIEPADSDTLYAFRIVAKNEDGESLPSDPLMGRINFDGPRILMVRGSPDEAADLTAPIPAEMWGIGSSLPAQSRIESVPAHRVGAGLVNLDPFDALMWFFEQDNPESHFLDSAERTVLANYLAGGKSLLVSGSQLAANMDPDFRGDEETGNFLSSVLHLRATAESSGAFIVNSLQSNLFQNISATSLNGCDTTAFPSNVLEPMGSARSELIFQPGAVGPAAISVEEGCRLVVLSAQLGCMTSLEQRDAYMERIMDFLIPPPAPEVGDFLAIH